MRPQDRPMTMTERGRFAQVLCVLGLLILLTTHAGCNAEYACSAEVAQGREPGKGLPGGQPSQVFRRQREIIRQMSEDYGVNITVSWKPCDQENSYYTGGLEPLIELCTEMSQHPGAAVMFAAHEMGHAVTDALASMVDEGAADELAMLAMVKHGYKQEMLEGALYYLQDTDLPLYHIRGDSHPSNLYRAWEFSCVESGSPGEGGPPECVQLYEGLKLKWEMRLQPVHNPPAKLLYLDFSIFAPRPPIAK